VSNYQLSINNYQLPEGYKQTEVGVIPEDWEVSSVGQEFEIQLGKMLDAEKNTGVLKPYIGNRAVQWGYFDVSDLSQMAMSHSDMEKFRLEVGDLIVCEGGEVGRSAIWDAPVEECYYQKALHRLRAKNNFNSQLMVAFLKYWTDFDLLSNYVSQTSIAHLTKEKFSQVPLPVPSTKEQRSIATALSDVDALIAALDKLIAKKRHLKTATMQQLLTGKKRLPGFGEGKGYKQTEVGVIPEDWDVHLVGSLASVQRGASPRPIDSPVWFERNSLVGWVRISDVTCSGMYLYETEQKLSPLGIQHSRPVSKGSLIMSICATVGRPIITKIDVCIHDGFVVLDNLQAEQLFMYYVLKWIEPSWAKQGQTGSQMNLNTELINSTVVCLPPAPEQRAIATVLSDMDSEIAAIEARRAKTQAIKQGMMQQLLTGKVRLVASA
jgi:type I restriction enzyme S subunit